MPAQNADSTSQSRPDSETTPSETSLSATDAAGPWYPDDELSQLTWQENVVKCSPCNKATVAYTTKIHVFSGQNGVEEKSKRLEFCTECGNLRLIK